MADWGQCCGKAATSDLQWDFPASSGQGRLPQCLIKASFKILRWDEEVITLDEGHWAAGWTGASAEWTRVSAEMLRLMAAPREAIRFDCPEATSMKLDIRESFFCSSSESHRISLLFFLILSPKSTLKVICWPLPWVQWVLQPWPLRHCLTTGGQREHRQKEYRLKNNSAEGT